MFYSPLRYPGGKSKLTPYILETLKLNNLVGGTYVEPFAGGAAIAWHLLLEGHVKKVYINDLNPSIYAFWYCVLNMTDQLCTLIKNTPITIEEWHKQKVIHRNQQSNLLERGFSTLFLNRTNHSGIIKAGVIGGFSQKGNYKIDCRFNKNRIIGQIYKIAEKRKKINLKNLDANDFIVKVLPSINKICLVNIDPPYYVKGKGLYQNFLNHEDHYKLYETIKNITHPWIVTYDDTPEINDIYSKYNPKPYGLTYTAQIKRKGSEVMIHSPILEVCKYKPDITFKELKSINSN